MPPGLRRNSIAAGIRRASTIASWPAPLAMLMHRNTALGHRAFEQRGQRARPSAMRGLVEAHLVDRSVEPAARGDVARQRQQLRAAARTRVPVVRSGARRG